jgi:hypothetical protein
LIIKDPRINQTQNDKFLDMMEKYFSKRSKDYYSNKSTKDVFPEKHFQIGAIPEFT